MNIYQRVCLGGLVAIVVGCASQTTEDPGVASTQPEPDVKEYDVEEVIVTKSRRAPARVPESGRSHRQKQKARIVQDKSDSPVSPLDIEHGYWNHERAYQIFRDYGVNPTVITAAKPDSTFAMDVDDGSYKLALAMLDSGSMPDAAGIRVEEFVNALSYRYHASEELFSLSAEAMPSPFRAGYHVLHLGIQARQTPDEERPPANLVLVADVSGSMADDSKLELLKDAFKTLVSQLHYDDRVALVAYNNAAHVVLPPTGAENRRRIDHAIDNLHSGGSTNAAAGIQLAYRMADTMFQQGHINRVVITSDGMANVGDTSPEAIVKKVKRQRRKGIFLTTVGVGTQVYNDALLEQLANQGNGHYLYLGNREDIQAAFVDGLNSQLQTVAKNAKVQVVFDERSVSHYRLLGYENRALNKQDFLDADKDGGELGAGHRVTALYEIKLSEAVSESSLGTFSIAYQYPLGRRVHTIKKSIPAAIVQDYPEDSSTDMRLSVSAAAFAEKLRMSYWSAAYTYDDILNLLASLPAALSQDNQVYRLRNAVVHARNLDGRQHPYAEAARVSTFNLDHVPLLQ